MNKYAILIGINNYHESLGKLKFCVPDAVLAWCLLEMPWAGFGSLAILILAIVAALLYNIRIMTFAIKLEEE